MALGYILGESSARLLKEKLIIPIALTLSVLPDIDILLPFVRHRGPVHSIVVAFVGFLPFLVIYRKKAIPYFVALAQHSLVGDYIAGGQQGIQLLWPLTTQSYGTGISITSQVNISLEWIAFVISLVVMMWTKEIVSFFQPHASNLILAIPTFTVLLPTVLSFPLNVPVSLIPPHLVYLLMFSASIIISFKSATAKNLWWWRSRSQNH